MLDPNINCTSFEIFDKKLYYNDNKNEKQKLRFYYQSLEKKCVLDLV
jgi:hypothetical protein